MNNEEKRKFILEQCELFDLYHEKGTKGDHEAKRILNILDACDDYLCPSEYNNTTGGCNCGKS